MHYACAIANQQCAGLQKNIYSKLGLIKLYISCFQLNHLKIIQWKLLFFSLSNLLKFIIFLIMKIANSTISLTTAWKVPFPPPPWNKSSDINSINWQVNFFSKMFLYKLLAYTKLQFGWYDLDIHEKLVKLNMIFILFYFIIIFT